MTGILRIGEWEKNEPGIGGVDVEKIGFLAAAGSAALCAAFLYSNAHADPPIGRDTVRILLVMIAAPACLGMAAALFRARFLMWAAWVWSLPCCLYLGLAAMPSLYNLFIAVLIGYFVSAVRMSADRLRESGRR
ncbi:hypothetical protein I8J29_08855 [Paenibacillus sp. MWE-103]|uniref:SPW repeat-containing protein n=1 Tax=Paenibacillus artemisiicola TaxID=1172618 RepID=A0ABS3W7K6_9BACL|nr:hypothetical protein [Paenibacillus artemisiicola]MBO7744301.1 hypothetical protein [Paenibacillus artemisiicola]